MTVKQTSDAAGSAALPFPPPPVFRAIFLIFILVSLAACAGSEPPMPAASVTAAAQAAVSRLPSPKPLPKPLPEPGAVMGLSAAAVTALLGPPDYRRRDKPAEIWQYRNDACVLDLFLYSVAGASARVNHMDFRRLGTDRNKAGLSDRECFQGFLRSATD